MMKVNYIFYIVSLFFMLAHISLTAQELPSMPDDSGIDKGVLPNGTHYYVVKNPSSKGMADFALVQRAGTGLEDQETFEQISESVLSCLPGLNDLSPRKYFSQNGVVPHKGRFLEMLDGAAVYRFSNMMIASKPDMLDSTLLVLTEMINASCEGENDYLNSCYSPSDAAVVISGDIDAESVIGKLKMLSYMVPRRPYIERPEYLWQDSPAAFSVKPSQKSTSEIEAVWRIRRIPEKFIGTIQPVVLGKMMDELGTITCNRIRNAFLENDIPSAKVSYDYVSSAESIEDEEFHIRATVWESSADEAVAVMADAISSVAQKGITPEEAKTASALFIRNLSRSVSKPTTSDAYYTEMCISTFLSNAQPISKSQLYKFHTSKAIPIAAHTSALSRLAKVVMTADRNLSLTCSSKDSLFARSMEQIFVSAWSDTTKAERPSPKHIPDTLGNTTPTGKIQLSFIWKEYMSGGSLWTFSNGVRVVYKRMNTGGRLYWAMGLSSGFGCIPDLKDGEGAFVTDVLKTSKVSGVPWDDYMNYLAENGIDVETSVRLLNTTIRGSAPYNALPQVIRLLRAIAYEREVDSDRFQSYKRNEQLRLDGVSSSSHVVVDSLMCPDYRFSSIKTQGKLTDALLLKSEALFDEMFSRINDGIIVLIGDQDESLVRQELREYVGFFHTDKSAPKRSSISYHPTSGSMLHISEGSTNAIYMAMSLPMKLTMRSYQTSELAGMVLKERIPSAIVGSGMYAKVYSDTRINPHERFNVMVVMNEVKGKTADEEAARESVASVLEPDAIAKITDSRIEAGKSYLKHIYSQNIQSPVYWVNALLLRYLEGKDLTTGYNKEMDNVSPNMVRDLLLKLNQSSRVEYIIRDDDTRNDNTN